MDVKETVDQAIQQGNARVSNGNQADVGELAAHSCPLERKGNHGARSQWKHVLECTSQWSTQQYIKKYDSRQSTWVCLQPSPPFSSTSPRGVLKCTRHWSTIHEERTGPSYLTRELGTQFLAKGPETRGIRGNNDSVGGNRGQRRKKRLQNRGNRGQQLESGATRILPEFSE
ncbi:hypothetical protein R3P38DRAFT_2808799 [Favolaschia claudopus]|uniref:Uncharacterized protein n=1 Tax=Favolaschia claudopus TaxID=2862362 RepID=A0AAV9ZFU7_9AGAR